jgi:hypothetical protein
MRTDSVVRDLAAQPMTDWPKHLRLAWEILAKKRVIDEVAARTMLFASLSAAHRCARAIDQRSREHTGSMGVQKLQKVFARIAKCIRRSPASLRQVLDRDVGSHVRSAIIDLESMEALIDRLIAGFAALPKEEASLTILRALYPKVLLPKSKRVDVLRRRFAEAAVFLKNDYAALPSVYQRKVEATLATLRGRRAQFDAADVCEEITNALEGAEKRTTQKFISDLITNFVSEVALIWLRRGLRLGRGVNVLKLDYHGPFHRFVEFVLTDVLEPWSKRHDGEQSEMVAKLRKAYAQLSAEDRRDVRATLRRSDVAWLVCENHLKDAFSLIQKTVPRTP